MIRRIKEAIKQASNPGGPEASSPWAFVAFDVAFYSFLAFLAWKWIFPKDVISVEAIVGIGAAAALLNLWRRFRAIKSKRGKDG